ncbi:MAG: KamA family radical SAM protein [Ignavibacteriales bacterium UTCHB3]|nr:MAG: KamA family radical SAM protein [Ignavibacteriales bacterium UTCHB3]
MKELFNLDKKQLLTTLWKIDPWIKSLLTSSSSVNDAREKLFEYLNDRERSCFNIFSEQPLKKLHIIDRQNAKESIRVFKNIIRTEHELLSGFNSVKILWELAAGNRETREQISEGYLIELIFLFHGIHGRWGEFAFKKGVFSEKTPSEQTLDQFAENMRKEMMRFKPGTHPLLKMNREKLKNKILQHFNAQPSDWFDHNWHLKHLIRDIDTLESIIKLEEHEIQGLLEAEKLKIDFQITPYYLSLFNDSGKTEDDRMVRAQVLPSTDYCRNVHESRELNLDMDFMDEAHTTPIDKITRRYPQIVILKIIDGCPQICVYCQRNWEIKPIERSEVDKNKIDNAIDWIAGNKNISEVLVTGGDPLTYNDKHLDKILKNLSVISHIERIRLATRVFATLPFRITDSFIEIITKYHQPGKREICLVTHFEHPTEVTDESIAAITKVRKAGLSVYNQQVFTYYNSRRFETSALRRVLKLSGVDPYYSFNTKGKKETIDFRVPLARIQQERKEEGRFLPGLVRTDEPVFNVPRMGKSHLRSWQDHEIIMINGNGERVYRFFPWLSRVVKVDDYLFNDVSIYDYLQRLNSDGEDIEQYSSIWFYY